MFTPSRDEARRFLVDAWARYRAGAPLAGLEHIAAGIVARHPEYHAIVEHPDRHLDSRLFPRGRRRQPVPAPVAAPRAGRAARHRPAARHPRPGRAPGARPWRRARRAARGHRVPRRDAVARAARTARRPTPRSISPASNGSGDPAVSTHGERPGRGGCRHDIGLPENRRRPKRQRAPRKAPFDSSRRRLRRWLAPPRAGC